MSVVADMCMDALMGRPPTDQEARRSRIMLGLKSITREIQMVGQYILTQVEIDQLNVKVEELDTSDAFPEEPLL